MDAAMKEVERRREIQTAYNKKHNITPKSIEKSIRAKLVEKEEIIEKTRETLLQMAQKQVLLPDEREDLIKRLTREMKESAKELDFETASLLRDQIKMLKAQ